MTKISIVTEDLLTIPEAMKLLGVSRMHLWRLRKEGKIQEIQLGKHTYLTKAEVERIAKEKEV